MAEMLEPITWRAIQCIREVVASIKRVDGYHTDLGLGEISTDRSQIKLEGQAKTLIVADNFVVSDVGTTRVVNSDLDITVEFAVPFGIDATDAEAELLAHRGAADLRRALNVANFRSAPINFRGLKIVATSFSTGIDDESFPFTLAQVTARAGLTENFLPAQP